MKRQLKAATALLAVMVLLGCATESRGAAKAAIYGIYMKPRGLGADSFADPTWGGGMRFILPIPRIPDFIAPVVGFDIVHFMSKKVEFQDRLTGLRTEQQTSQDWGRLYIGGELGPHGRGFFRPYAGANVALVIYGIDTDVVIPDDKDRENEIRQDLKGRTETVFGYDFTLGLDLQLKKVSLDGGVRYVKSFSLPVQLGDEAIEVHPEYTQIFIGIGYRFSY